jgi:hypothetical protein
MPEVLILSGLVGGYLALVGGVLWAIGLLTGGQGDEDDDLGR